jgi:hypothetical protein
VATFDEKLNALGATAPATSVGQTVAGTPAAGVQNPTQAPSVVAPSGRINAAAVETGTNAPTVTLTQSQATPAATPVYTAAQTNQNLSATGTNGTATASTQAGVGATTEDNSKTSSTAAQKIISASFNQTIIPQPNVLDKYVSYTYGVTWYLITPQQFTAFQNGNRNFATWSLLAKSGGASQIGRNQFFQLDYYMDNFVIETTCIGKGTGTPTQATSIEFSVTEPAGLTLIPNLYKAVDTLYKQNNLSNGGATSYLAANYCLVFRFYGYDEAGNLLNPIRGQGVVGYPNIPSDPKAVVERYYPFLIQDINFTMANKVIEYRVKGQPIPYQTAVSFDRGSIPFQFELVGETVNDILVGKPVGTQYAATTGERVTSPTPAPTQPATAPTVTVGDLPVAQQAAIATGSDPSLVGTDGVAYGGII